MIRAGVPLVQLLGLVTRERRKFPKLGTVLGQGGSGMYAKTTVGAKTVVPAKTGARLATIEVKVTEAFTTGTGTKPNFAIGEADTPNKYNDGTAFANGTPGQIFRYVGTLSSTKALIVTGTAATGNGTGAVEVNAVALPATE